jgi:hypothetical protein
MAVGKRLYIGIRHHRKNPSQEIDLGRSETAVLIFFAGTHVRHFNFSSSQKVQIIIPWNILSEFRMFVSLNTISIVGSGNSGLSHAPRSSSDL